MEAEDLLDKFAQDEGFGNWETVVLNCHHSVIISVAIAAVNQALRQPTVISSVCTCTKVRETPMINGKHICSICNKPIVETDLYHPYKPNK